MMATIQRTIQTVPFDLNKSLRSIARYAWLSAGVFFVCYLYFVGAITFSIIKEQGLQQHTKTLISSMSQQEMAYLTIQKNLTQDYAGQLGLVATTIVSFATPKQAFAWNVGQ